jgi:hypothetical protein
MERRKILISSDLAVRSNLSALHVDRMNSIIDKKFSDPEFLPIPESITRGNEGTSFGDLEYEANVARW